jgi:hypothetical protein
MELYKVVIFYLLSNQEGTLVAGHSAAPQEIISDWYRVQLYSILWFHGLQYTLLPQVGIVL